LLSPWIIFASVYLPCAGDDLVRQFQTVSAARAANITVAVVGA
jgi:hypothetical protein